MACDIARYHAVTPARRLLVCLVALVPLIVGLSAWWFRPAPHPEGAGSLRVVPGAAPTAPPISSPTALSSAAPVAEAAIDPIIAARIRTAARDPEARLRDVTVAGDHRQIACGEIAMSNSARYVRFIWLGDLDRLAADDGTGDYAQFALLCDGKGIPGP